MTDRCLSLALRSTSQGLSFHRHVKNFPATLRISSTTASAHSETSEKKSSKIEFQVKEKRNYHYPQRHQPELFLSPRKQTTVHVKNLSKLTREDVLDALKSFEYSKEEWVKEKSRTPKAIVILATPSFATWLEDGGGFVDQVLRRITRGLPWDKDFQRIKLDVVCACVDSLSPEPQKISTGREKLEGFSFLYGQSGLIAPDLWRRRPANPSLSSTLTFSSIAKGSCEVTLPLANTLFKTGKQSMLQVSRWEQDSKDNLVKVKGPFDKTNTKIAIFQVIRDMKERVPRSYTPGIPLTPARAIVNGLGNIVKRLKYDYLIGPASQELEASVDNRLKTMGVQNTIGVWALVIPYEAIHESLGSPNKLAVDHSELENIRCTNNSSDYIAHWIKRGATLCRVLSGGGGWGPKQGLLSLDPHIIYNTVSEARFDFSDGTLEEQQTSALGNIAKKGDYIQFFTAQLSKTDAVETSYKFSKFNYIDYDVRSSVIGAVPSTIDEAPEPLVEDMQQHESGSTSISVSRGHFGCVSETGMFLCRKEGESLATKIDLPYSYFMVHHTKGEGVMPKPIIRKIDPYIFRKVDPSPSFRKLDQGRGDVKGDYGSSGNNMKPIERKRLITLAS